MRRVYRTHRRLGGGLILALGLGACQPADGAEGRPAETADPADPGHAVMQAGPAVVDSIRPLEDEVARFRATLTHHPERLTAGAPSLQALVDTFTAAVNEDDAAALAALAVTRSEFAYFYYPYTHYTRPPYELAPALVWYRLGNRSGQGMERLLATFEHAGLRVRSLACVAPEPAGAGRIHDCSAEVRDVDGEWVEVRLFGPVLERDGRYKLLSFANDL